MFNLNNLLRPNIRNLVPYASARDEFKGQARVFLDANENSFGSPLQQSWNRYPDPLQKELRKKLATLKGLAPDTIFLGNGSDEPIDLLIRACCEPGADQVLVCPPTYGMYEVAASINNVNVLKIPLLPESFQLDTEKILAALNPNLKLIFLCCPNNPTGNGVSRKAILSILEQFDGLVVVDEAYIDFAAYAGMSNELARYPNLVILQTLSKAWGLAGLRIGMAFGSAELIAVLNKIKAPYNLNAVSQQLAIEALDNSYRVTNWIKETVAERERLSTALEGFPFVQKVYPSQANFLLVKVDEPSTLYNYLAANGVVVRDRSKTTLCDGCLRFTVGTPEENNELIGFLKTHNA